MIALGTAVGGWRLIRTLGGKFYKIRPVDGFAAQIGLGGGDPGRLPSWGAGQHHPGGQLSHHGGGRGERVNKVRWGVAEDIAVAWLLTIPATALVAAGICLDHSRLGL